MDTTTNRPFRDRAEAGRLLAEKLRQYVDKPDVVVLALPRGGVVVGDEVARALHAPFDVLLVRKLGVPGHEELAMGAVASIGPPIVNPDIVAGYDIDQQTFNTVLQRERSKLEAQERFYGRDHPLEARDKVAIIVDDGLATGSTMRAAIAALRQHNAQRVVVAVPVGAAETCVFMQGEADEVVCLFHPPYFYAVGLWYRDFSPVSDEQVRELLQRAEHAPAH